MSDEEVKYDLVTQFGILARDKDGNLIAIMLPETVNPKSVGIEYGVPYKTGVTGKTKTVYYKVYAQTRFYTTAEMNALIDGAIRVAQTIGVPTDTPEEIAKMKSLWATEKE